ncbi:MAG TPA: hypothetical protein VNS09_07830 [Solirubrobacter sp.]|nr:hypothetical protein [Solirubrobacter sp.]
MSHEARALTRLVADELAAVPAGIGDVHSAIAGRVFGALGASAAPVRAVHDGVTRVAYASVGVGLWMGASAAGAAWRVAAARRAAAPTRPAATSPLAATPRPAATSPSAPASHPAAATPRAAPTPLSDTPRGAVFLAALNALVGDRLAAEGNPLALETGVRRVAGPVGPHVVVFLHGLGETEYAWGRSGYAAQLAGATSVFVRYNSGRHVSENGAALAVLLDELVRDWPVPVERISLVGHSMGGLVALSACHAGGEWTRRVKHVVTLGTPHAGAPLEQGVHALSAALHALPETRPFARFLRRRSAGIRDLRHGALVDADWHGQDPDALRARALAEVPPLPGVTYCFVAATVTRSPTHPLGRLVGDLLVLAPSASGRVAFHDGLELGAAHHLALLDHPAVAERLRAWLA